MVREYGRCAACSRLKTVNRIVMAGVELSIVGMRSQVHSVPSTTAWYWEGNVQASLVSWLATRGCLIRSVADTASRVQGKDIIAVEPDGRELWISVKGYPENSPHVQARHWFSGAVFDLVLYRGENPNARLALGLPDGFATYAGLAARVTWLRKEMPFAIYWVDRAGEVRAE